MTPLVSDAANVHAVAPLGERPRPHNLGMRTSAICQTDSPRRDTLCARGARAERAMRLIFAMRALCSRRARAPYGGTLRNAALQVLPRS